MRQLQARLFRFCAVLLITAVASAQNAIQIEPAHGRLGWLLNPYRTRGVPPINLNNSSRLESLVRAGNLYLSAQDVVALAIENNLDVEVQRYGPLLAREVLRRAQAGGALRSVGLGVARRARRASACKASASTLLDAAVNTGGNGVSSGGGIVTQLGPAIPSLDPNVLGVANFQHATIRRATRFSPAPRR